MGAKEGLLADITRHDKSGSVQDIHNQLIAHGFKWKGPSNSQTLLYLFRLDGKEIGVAAMRKGIFSFPAAFWRPRATALKRLLSIKESAKVEVIPFVPVTVGKHGVASPPGNRLEPLRGELKNFYSIRINSQWRIIFRWAENSATDVQIVDYH